MSLSPAKVSINQQIVASGKKSVKGKISSVNSKINTILLPNKERNIIAAIGAHTTSVTSPMKGISSDEVPIVSMIKHKNSFPISTLSGAV